MDKVKNDNLIMVEQKDNIIQNMADELNVIKTESSAKDVLLEDQKKIAHDQKIIITDQQKVIEKKEPSKETNRTKPIVEGKKSNNAGLWFLIILLISAGVGFYFYNQNKAISSEMNNNKQDVINENPISDNVNNEVSAQEVLQQTQTAPNTSVNNSSTISGNFPQASKRLLTSSDLSALGKQDLKIMRNEIFARHGYIFKTQEMKSYFENQSWYSGQYNDVISMLSAIEMQNIELIKRYE